MNVKSERSTCWLDAYVAKGGNQGRWCACPRLPRITLHFIRATLATLYVPPLYLFEIRHALLLAFTNGETRHFDMTPYPGYPAFEP